MSEVVVIGAGGHAKAVISTLQAAGHRVVAVYDDDQARWGSEILGVPVRGPVAAAGEAGAASGVVAIGGNALRKKIAGRVRLRWLTVVHPAAWVAPDAQLGAGTVVFAGAIIQPGCVVGQHVIINTGATIDHDCMIADWAHLAPGVRLAGHVGVGEGAFLGIGCSAIPARKIGAWTTVGAGAVVVRDLVDDVVAYGVPARAKRPSGSRPDDLPRCRVIHAHEEDEWLEVLARTAQHDFYHLPQYHRVEEERSGGVAHLFAYREGEYVIALPVLLRPVDASAPEGWKDATSVYGYGGAVASHKAMPEEVVRNFRAALKEAFTERRVVAAFSRLHPLLPQSDLFAGLGECRIHGQAVSVDLTLPPEVQRAQYRSVNKTRINKLRREGVVCVRDETKRHLPEFISIYRETMRRVNADGSYFFGDDYFTRLTEELGDKLHLFVAMVGETVAAAGLFVLCDGIIQYHLSGTRDHFLGVSPMTLMLHTVRLWGNEIGARVLYLGGGVGSRNDSLFHFKAGFSNCRHYFGTWRWLVAPEIYRELCEERRRRDERDGLAAVSADFFPAYRCPSAPRVPEPGAIVNI